MSASRTVKGTLARLWGNKWLRYLGTIFLLLVSLLVTASLSAPRARDGKAERAEREARSGDAERFDDAVPSALEIRAFAGSFSSEIAAQRERVSTLGARVEALDNRIEELHALHRRLVTAVELLQNQDIARDQRPGAGAGKQAEERDISNAATVEPVEASRLRTLVVDANAKEPPETRRMVRIPAGSFASCTLLTGIYAPTTGEPLPVLLRVDELAIGPNKSRVPIRGAFLVGKAQGDANSRRAVVQLVTLSLVLADGTAIEQPVNGYVADEDGVQGARGAYVYRVGEIAGHASLAAGLEGLSEAFRAIHTARTINPLGGVTDTIDPENAGKVAGVSSASKALSRLSDVFTKRLNEVVPAIHVANGGRVTAVFLQSVTLEGFEPEQAHESHGRPRRSPYAGLDAHR